MTIIGTLVLVALSAGLAGSTLANCSLDRASLPQSGNPCCPHHQPQSSPVEHCPQSVCISADTDLVADLAAQIKEDGGAKLTADLIGMPRLSDATSLTRHVDASAGAGMPGAGTSFLRSTILRI
jgi:hypothetical protein